MQSGVPDNAVTYKLVVVGEGNVQRRLDLLLLSLLLGGVGKSALTIQVSQTPKFLTENE